MTDHRGNVNVVVSDRKLSAEDGSTGNTDYYTADVVSYADYYPGGMLMPGRSGNSDSYRYAFMGYEGDPEVSGNGNSYTTEFRQYDPRLMRWKSVDPMMAKYADWSPYCAYVNNPILIVDDRGDEIHIWYKDENGEAKSYIVGSGQDLPDNEFVHQTMEVLGILMIHDESKQIVENLVVRDEVVNIYLTNGGTNFLYDITTSGGLTTNEIDGVEWNPSLGVEKKDGSENYGPWLALLHELGHTKRFLDMKLEVNSYVEEVLFAREYAEMSKRGTDPVWMNQEERENITENEIPVARAFGVMIRENYSVDYRPITGMNYLDLGISDEAGDQGRADKLTGYKSAQEVKVELNNLVKSQKE